MESRKDLRTARPCAATRQKQSNPQCYASAPRSERRAPSRLPRTNSNKLSLNQYRRARWHWVCQNIVGSIAADDLAYILFTSGSTGQPKGVLQNHRNVLNQIKRETHGLHICAGRSTDSCTLLQCHRGNPNRLERIAKRRIRVSIRCGASRSCRTRRGAGAGGDHHL